MRRTCHAPTPRTSWSGHTSAAPTRTPRAATSTSRSPWRAGNATDRLRECRLDGRRPAEELTGVTRAGDGGSSANGRQSMGWKESGDRERRGTSSALLVMDVQPGVVDRHGAGDGVLDRLTGAVAAARRAG